ncbi:MAG: PhoH family protein [Candidatus Auribacterota bacterium]
MTKIFVLDTNVLLHNPAALTAFSDNTVVLPIEVLEELDKFKKAHDEKGRNARITIRNLDKLRESGSLKSGVKLENGGKLMIGFLSTQDIFKDKGLPLDEVDNRLLATAYELAQTHKKVIFVSKDINARIKADSLGILSEDFEQQKVNIQELYSGWREIEVNRIPRNIGELPPETKDDPPSPNEFFMYVETHNRSNYLITRHDYRSNSLYPVHNTIDSLWGVVPRNPQQVMAQELLTDTRVELVSLVGQAGTGKTLLAIAAGLYMVIEKKVYNRLLISRPIMPLGKDLGYLPGTKEEKLENWMEPIFDNLEYILTSLRKNANHRLLTVKELIASEVIQLEALTYMRGRSIPRQFIIVDEAQNLTPHEIKTVVTRLGNNAKMVLTGDPYQIDSPYLDSDSNGLTYCVDRMKDQDLFGHVLFTKSERGRLASIAAQLL